jgi:hypothetical protein
MITRVGTAWRVERRYWISDPVSGQTQYRFVNHNHRKLAPGDRLACGVSHFDID